MFAGMAMVMPMTMIVLMVVAVAAIRAVDMPMIVFVSMVMIVSMVMSVIMAVAVRMLVAVLMSVIVIMPVIVRTAMIVMRMSVIVPMVVMPVPVRIGRLRQGMILSERRIVAVPVTAAVGARLRVEGGLGFFHPHAQAQQHVAQDRVVLQLQRAGLDLYRRVAVAEVIGGAHQQQRIVAGDAQHRLGRGRHLHQRAVGGDQHGAVAQDGAARQEQRGLAAVVQRDRQPAAAAVFIRQGQRSRALAQGRRDRALENFFDTKHMQKP